VDAELISRAEDHLDLILAVRRSRSEILGADLFSDPAWDILLQLCGAYLHGRKTALGDLETGAPKSTVARWTAVLERRGLIRCSLDCSSSSGLRMELSERGALKMAELLRGFRTLRRDP